MSALFASLFDEVLFWVVLIVGFVVPLVWFGRWHRRSDGSVKKTGKDLSAVTNFLLIPTLAVAIVVGYARIGVLPNWLFYPGLVGWVVGMGLTVWAYRTLGSFFALTVRVQNDHRLIDTGPYRRIRHPGYAGVLLGLFGLGLALQSWLSVLLLLIASVGAFAYRVRLEEKFLVTELGDDYVQYMRRTKRIIPFIW